MKKQGHVLALKEEVEQLGYFVDFTAKDSDNDQHRQMHVFKDSGHRKPIAAVSLTIACRINMMFDGVGRRDAKLLDALVNYSKHL